MAWVVQITGFDTSGPGLTTKVFAMGAGIAFPDSTYAPSGFFSWKSANQKVDVAASGGVTLAADAGQLVLQNLPDDISLSGPLDALAFWAWQYRMAYLFWIGDGTWAGRQLVDTAMLEQPIAPLVSNGTVQSNLTFPLRDPRALLGVPLQPTKYLGTRTNLLLYSQDFTNAVWALSNCSIGSAISDPWGGTAANSIINASGFAASSSQTIAGLATSSLTFTASVWLKAGTLGGDVTLSLRDGAGTVAGTVTVTPTAGWVRYSLTATFPSGAVSGLTFRIAPVRVAGSVGLTTLIAGGQLESGSAMTTYIASTSAAAVQIGIEGGADVQGKPKPILYGIVSNIPGVRVNAALLLYQVADAAATILCVRDGALALNAGTVRGSIASILATNPAPGTYDIYSGVEGTFVRLGTTPIFGLGIDAAEGTPASNRTHAQIWSRMRTQRCGNVSGDLVAASIAAADALDANEVGWWFPDETTQLDMINSVLTSFSGYEVQGFDGKWTFAKLVAPSGTTVLDFTYVTPTSLLTMKNRAIRSLTLVRPGFAPDGAPPYLVNVQWGQNYQAMSPSQFAGAAPQRLRDKFGQQWRTETAINRTIWDPVALAGPWPNAPQLTVQTGYQPGADGLTCPQAQAEATRLVALYSANKPQYQLDFTPRPTDQINVGDVTSLTYAQLGLSTGPLFRVLQSALTVENELPRMSLVIGFQT